MHIVVLASFMVALTLVHPATRAKLMAPGWPGALALVGYLAVAAAMSRINTALALRALRREQGTSASWARRLNVLAILAQCWLIAGLAALVVMGYGRWVMDELDLARIPLIGKLAVLAPFFAAILLTWVLDYPFYRASRLRIARQQAALGAVLRPAWTRGQYIAYNLRHHVLFVVVPVGLIILATDVLLMYVYPILPEGIGDYILLALMILAALSVFLLAPLMIVRIWRTEPLGPGTLRQDLERTCRQMNLRCRSLLVWKSGGTIANAGVMGLIGPVRYVLLSDMLLEQMDHDHIKAIFAHEAGHIVARHIFHAAVFAVASVLLCGAAGEFIIQSFDWPLGAGEAIMLAMLALTWGLGFGWISRRFERQSDVMAARACDTGAGIGRITPGGADTFVQALQRVAELNGISPTQRNWRHGSIEHRINYILALGQAGGDGARIDRTVRRIKLGLWLALAAGVAATVAQFYLYP